jgi:hypothetical protein
MSGYNGWLLPQHERNRLLNVFVPSYERVLAHHCTLKFPATNTDPLPSATEAMVIGVVNDGKGVEALVLSIDGTPNRPDGSTYHITWSLAAGRKPVESNAVIRTHVYERLDPIRIDLVPTFFPAEKK